MAYCRHEPKKVKSIDGISYYGASQDGALEFDGELMINFTRQSDIPSVMNVPELACYVEINFEEIMVPWPDFSVPLVDPDFWRALHNYVMRKNWEHVCFHCEAGHGRTGTALCSMLIALCGYSALDAVGHVRSIYCEEAVETWEQSTYLQELDEYFNDRKIVEEDCPVPAMVIAMQKREEEQKKKQAQKLKQGWVKLDPITGKLTV